MSTDRERLDRIASQDEVEQRLADPSLLIVDLGAATAYVRGHLPGAMPMAYADLVASEGRAGGMLPAVDKLAGVLASVGFARDRQLLACDDEGGGRAARLLWTLDVLGLPAGALLDGGVGAWARAGRPLASGDAQPVAARADAAPAALAGSGSASADLDYVLAHFEQPDVVVLDVRSPAEYSGEDAHAARGGHIPGAVNYDWRRAVEGGSDGLLKPAHELRADMARLGVTPDKEVIVHCQTHHRSSHTYWWLRWLGFERVRGYPGSWSEWGNQPDTPARTGPQP